MMQAAMLPPYLILTEAELPEARIALRAPYLLFHWSPAPLHPWRFQGPRDPSSSSTSTPSPQWGRLKSFRPGAGANSSAHAEVQIKSQLNHRGSVAKEVDQKPSHQLYKLQIKSTQSTRQTLCLWNILKGNESSYCCRC